MASTTTLTATTNTATAPEIAIVSPTPRTFSFPINCQLAVPDLSPVTSPSSSPFEPDLSAMSFALPSPCGTPMQSPWSLELLLSPAHRARQESRSPSLSPSRSHSRTSSRVTSSSPIPKKGDLDYIKRPENAFILFRRKCCEDKAADMAAYKARGGKRKPRQADLSKSISQQWKSLTPAERQYWEELAKEKKKEHEELYPEYVYRPQRARDKDGNIKPRRPRGSRLKELAAKQAAKAEKELLEESSRVPIPPTLNLIVPTGYKPGRSMSLPSSRELLEIPNVYSCPTSPMKARMSAPGFGDKPYILSDDLQAMEWTGMGNGFAMPWGVNWAPSLAPCHFPNSEFSLDSGIIPIDISPCVSSPSSSLPSLDPLDFPLGVNQFPTCDSMGLDIEVDFSTQPLGYASMAWEQVNPAWGSPAAIPGFNEQPFVLNDNTTSSWGLSGVPSMELGVPTEPIQTSP